MMGMYISQNALLLYHDLQCCFWFYFFSKYAFLRVYLFELFQKLYDVRIPYDADRLGIIWRIVLVFRKYLSGAEQQMSPPVVQTIICVSKMRYLEYEISRLEHFRAKLRVNF